MDLSIDEDQPVSRTSAWYYPKDFDDVDAEVLEVKNNQTLRELHKIFMYKYERR